MSDALRVDWLLCDAYGYCAELLPEIVERDEWGYPIVAAEIPPELLTQARRAAEACPRLALRIEQRSPDHRSPERRLNVL
jgi:ferredoxin